MMRKRKSIYLIICALVFLFAITTYADSYWKCENCGKQVITILGNICPYCGTQRHEHSWQEAACTEPKTCTVCGATEGAALGHHWDEGIVVKSATCHETGLKSYTCIVCGTTRDEILEKNPVNHSGETEVRDEQPVTFTTNGYTGDIYCKDCGELISQGNIIDAVINNVAVGDIVTFGSYEQDNNLDNGKESIEWKILEITDGQALLLSKRALDFKPYNYFSTDVTWETCSLREWLNGSFLNDAFNSSEQDMIQINIVTADKNPWYNTSPGKDTKDRVFLLSISEADRYFGSDKERKCKGTAYYYANVHGTYKQSAGYCNWWLRSPGDSPKSAAYVDTLGSGYYFDENVDVDSVAVRPALWINLES